MFWDTRKNTAECVFVQFCDTRKNIAECDSCGDEEKEKNGNSECVSICEWKKEENTAECVSNFFTEDDVLRLSKKHSGMCFCPILVTLDRTQRNVFRVEMREEKNGNSECVSICNWKNEENTAECVSGWRYASPRKRKKKERRC